MGVYIKGMKMPKTCEECFLVSSCIGRHWEITKDDIGYKGEYVKDNCPLIEVPEPHGRLIDVDKVFDEAEKILYENKYISIADIDDFRNAPTVIERSNKTSIDVSQLNFGTPITMTESLADVSPMEWSKDVLIGEKKVDIGEK